MIGPAYGSRAIEQITLAERRTNKLWIDGRSIYEKVVNFGALPNTTEKTVAHGITGSYTVICLTSMAQQGSGGAIAIPNGQVNEVSLSMDATIVNITTGSDLSTLTALVYIRYVKD